MCKPKLLIFFVVVTLVFKYHNNLIQLYGEESY